MIPHASFRSRCDRALARLILLACLAGGALACSDEGPAAYLVVVVSADAKLAPIARTTFEVPSLKVSVTRPRDLPRDRALRLGLGLSRQSSDVVTVQARAYDAADVCIGSGSGTGRADGEVLLRVTAGCDAPVDAGNPADAADAGDDASDAAGRDAERDDASGAVEDAGSDGAADGGGCADGSCQPVCTPNEVHCSAGKLEACNAAGTAWSPQNDCAGLGCVVGPPARCHVCMAGVVRCNGTARVQCASDGLSWNAAGVCAADGSACMSDSTCVSGACRRYYRDADGDGVPGTAVMLCGTSAPPGHSTTSEDCCDEDPLQKPGAAARATISKCNSWDYDCSGTVERCAVPVQSDTGTSCTSLATPCACSPSNTSAVCWASAPSSAPPCGFSGAVTTQYWDTNINICRTPPVSIPDHEVRCR